MYSPRHVAQSNLEPSIKKPMQLILHGLFYCLVLLLLSSCSTLRAATSNTDSDTYNYPISPDRSDLKHMQIQLLGSLVLKAAKVNSIPVHELSGIAWDKDEQLLYAVSDEGFLYHLKLSLKENKLDSLTIFKATRLKNISGNPLLGKYSDSEGLSLLNANNGKKGDSELIISFENKPRIARYSPQGKYISSVKTPKNLRKRKYYRHNNKALESVAVHPKYGVITASEYPQKKQLLSVQTIYSSKGKQWHFAASKEKNSSITGLEILPNGDALVLERAYSGPFVPINIRIRQISLEGCDKNQFCKTKTIANFNGADGWLLDNFEGLTHIKDNQYLVVSDNNKSFLQKTIFILFEIL